MKIKLNKITSRFYTYQIIVWQSRDVLLFCLIKREDVLRYFFHIGLQGENYNGWQTEG
jgi:hypothetical protein